MKNVKLNIPSHLDLPKYKTSSTTVNPEFSNYTWIILAEFFDPSHAYAFEQQLICDNWENPLLLNEHYNLGENQFRNSGSCSDKTKKKMSDARKGKTHSAETKQKMTGKTHSAETKQKISDANKGKPCSDATKQKLSDARKGKPAWNKGIPSPKKGIPNGKQQNPAPEVECPHCGLVGRGNMTRYHFDNCKKKPI